MNLPSIVGVCLLVANAAAVAAQECPSIETSMVDKGFYAAAPWRVVSGGAAECSFMTANTSINFGFNHMVTESAEGARIAAVEMRDAVSASSAVEPMLSLGEEGFAYQPKKESGEIDRTSMFFYGHRGRVNVSGYLNLADGITSEQRDLAANLIATTLGVAARPRALAKQTKCPHLDAGRVRRLLPTGDLSSIVTDPDNCVVSADGRVITVAVTKDARGPQTVERMLRDSGCTVAPLPRLGKTAGIAHHCSEGNPRAEVLFASRSRMFRLVFVSTGEPGEDERTALIKLAEAAARK
jgi:hypothetical protein